MDRKRADPSRVWEEYTTGKRFKEAIGSRGLYEQNRMNERFFVGDQWYGANCGNDRPLVRHNVIKRIGDYKMAVVGGSPITVNYSAEGVPNTLDLKQAVQAKREMLAGGGAEAFATEKVPTDEEINVVMSALSDYFRVTAERVKFDDLKELALRNAYTSGTGILYTYWDDSILTGMYADAARKTAVTGDIRCEVLDIENVYFGDPNIDDIQAQPYILIVQRKSVEELRREARANGASDSDIENIHPDSDVGYMAGQYGMEEPPESKKATVITKLWKERDEKKGAITVRAVRTCDTVVIREEWDAGIRLYPLAKFSWERRRNCIYGESEITYLIPNQIAINRMITASVWAVMMMGMPIMVVNGDVVTEEITNDPGQIIRAYGEANDVASGIRYVNPPNFSPNFDNNVMSLINNTLTQAGANDAALGDIRPENTSAIIAVREAATMPLQQVQNRYYSFFEDLARIWAEYWLTQYGDRSLKIEDESGTWYMPFKAERYKDLLITTKIDVGASTLWSEAQSIRTLDNLFDRQVIDVVQYLSRLPKGTIPNLNGLLRDLQAANEAISAQQAQATPAGGKAPSAGDTARTEEEILSGVDPQYRELLDTLPRQTKAALVRGVMNTEAVKPEATLPGMTI